MGFMKPAKSFGTGQSHQNFSKDRRYECFQLAFFPLDAAFFDDFGRIIQCAADGQPR
jgi:hypothetical protein